MSTVPTPASLYSTLQVTRDLNVSSDTVMRRFAEPGVIDLGTPKTCMPKSPAAGVASIVEVRGRRKAASILAAGVQDIRTGGSLRSTTMPPGITDPKAEGYFRASPRSAIKPSPEANVDPPTPALDETEVHLLIEFFMLLKRWDDTLHTKHKPAGVVPSAEDVAA